MFPPSKHSSVDVRATADSFGDMQILQSCELAGVDEGGCYLKMHSTGFDCLFNSFFVCLG